MSKIPFEKLEANEPGRDDRGKKEAPHTAKVDAVHYKKALMGRSKFPSKNGTQS